MGPELSNESGDAARIQQGIDEATAEERPIDEPTARLIASQLHNGMSSPYYALASTGSIEYEGLIESIVRDEASETLEPDAKSWLGPLAVYLASQSSPERDDTPEVEHEYNPKVRIGTWGAYNAGHLHGDWVSAARDEDEVWADVNRILATSPVGPEEEFGIFDYEDFAGVRIGESDQISRVVKIAKLVQEHGEAFGDWLDYTGETDLDDVEEKFQESYMGHFDDEGALQAYIEEEHGIEDMVFDALKHLPEWMQNYTKFDIEGYVRDLQYNGDIYIAETTKGDINVFRQS